MYVIVTNYVNWHGKFAVGQGKNKENTGNMKIQLSGYPVPSLKRLGDRQVTIP